MASRNRKTITIQVNVNLLAALRELAQSEGRELQALVDEALVDLIKKRKPGGARIHVMAAYQASHKEYAGLYRNLAE